MIKNFIEAFFPGFSWEHGFALFGVGEIVGAGMSIVGGMMGDDAASDAAGMQVGASREAIAEMRKIEDYAKGIDERTRKDTTPYRNLGAGAANKLSFLLGTGSKTDKYSIEDFLKYNADYAPSWYGEEGPQATDANTQYDKYLAHIQAGGDPQDFGGDLTRHGFRELNDYSGLKYGGLLDKFTLADLNSDVVYNKGLEFGLNEGNKAIERNATRFGNLDSGATLKALTRFGNDYGETKAGGAFDRFMADKAFTVNSLLGTTGVGQNAVNTDASTGVGLTNARANMASAIGNAQMQAGNAQAAGRMGGANAWSDALGGITNSLGGMGRGFGSIFGGKSSYVPEYSAGGIDLTRYFA